MGDLVPLQRVAGTPAELSDEGLVQAMAAGEPAALGALYDRYQADVTRFLARLAAPANPDLDDLVQSTFMQAHRSSAKFRGRSAVKTWLFGIGANLVRQAARSESRRRAAAWTRSTSCASDRRANFSLFADKLSDAGEGLGVAGNRWK